MYVKLSCNYHSDQETTTVPVPSALAACPLPVNIHSLTIAVTFPDFPFGFTTFPPVP